MLTADRWEHLWWQAFAWAQRRGFHGEAAARDAWAHMLAQHGDPPRYEVVDLPARPYPPRDLFTVDRWQIEVLRGFRLAEVAAFYPRTPPRPLCRVLG
ncbi:MAG TPA: hypothetical protein VGP26_24665 [Actinophytocola sp.]|jgi:hypothetical protein|nr:hypothetical protein [Actinophytocola sp.]